MYIEAYTNAYIHKHTNMNNIHLCKDTDGPDTTEQVDRERFIQA